MGKIRTLVLALLTGGLLFAGSLLALLAYKESQYRFYEKELGIGERPEFDLYWQVRDKLLQRRLPTVMPGYALFIGDSHLDGLAVSEILPRAMNAAIGGDTSQGVLGRISAWLERDPSIVVISVGLNDQRYRNAGSAGQAIAQISDLVGPERPLLLLTVLPIDPTVAWQSNEFVAQVNQQIRAVAEARSWVRVVDTVSAIAPHGQLPAGYHIGDGVHLNAAGQDRLIEEIEKVLALTNSEASGLPLPHRNQ